MKKTDKKDILLTISTAVKYLMAAVVILIGALSQKNSILFLLCGLAEEIVVFALGECILKKNRFLGWLISSILLVVIFAQYEVLKLGGDYTSVIMVTNLHSVRALSGNRWLYISAVILAVVDFLLPVRKIFTDYSWTLRGIVSGIVCDTVICCCAGIGYSPVLSMGRLGVQMYQREQMRKQISAHVKNGKYSGSLKLEPVADNGYKYPFTSKMPNVVLIFTEGLSQNIVDDDRDIMPNVKEWESKTLDFTNYYNHTAATYRGITGQLHSGWQFNDLDKNGLPSLQETLASVGYETTLINPEPHVADFTQYLKDQKFENFINGNDKTSNGDQDYVYDEEMYDLMYEQLAKADPDRPQFMAMYTFETHVSQDSHDKKYGDGSNAMLNKFYNDDAAFGNFMDRLENSDVGDNTLVVFTADHCTAKDADYDSTFGKVHEREAFFCDEIPLMFWYKGVKPEKIDVGGRNSLDMAPTLLDFLNIGQPDTFLGTSLFSQPAGNQLFEETTFDTPGQDQYFNTADGKIRKLTEAEKKKTDEVVLDYVARAKSAWNN